MNHKKSFLPLFCCIFLAFCMVFTPLCRISAAAKNAARAALDPATGLPRGTVLLGESTTTHWRIRGDLPHECVWANESGTMKLDATLLSRRILDPADGEKRTVTDALEMHRPAYLILSFGLNGILYFSEHPDAYLGIYRRMIEQIRTVSPETRVLVQTVYPVAEQAQQHNWCFSRSPAEINERILHLNDLLAEMCREPIGASLIDTAACLRDANGYLPARFTCDGIHLTSEAYAAILAELRAYFAKSA